VTLGQLILDLPHRTVVLILLYPICCWFAALKQNRTEWWLSYL
jgi:hypothetical protein